MIEASKKTIVIDESKVDGLNTLSSHDKVYIAECIDGPHKVELWLKHTIKNGKKRISLNGTALKQNRTEFIKQKEGVLGYFHPNKNGSAQIKSACSAYTIQDMYDLIIN